MSFPTSSELATISDVGKVLLEKISEALTGLLKPQQIRRVAEAEADARMTLAKADAEIDEIAQRSLTRLIREERQHQINMESVIKTAIPRLLESANPAKMDADWISDFFSKCRTVSDEEMQNLWANLLAEEANQPGRFSKRTLAVMASLDKQEAKIFERVCSIAVQIAPPDESFLIVSPVVLEPFDFYEDLGLFSSTFSELDTAGLVDYTSITHGVRSDKCDTYSSLSIRPAVTDDADSQVLTVSSKSKAGFPLNLGRVAFSRAGTELAWVCRVRPAVELLEHLRKALTLGGFEASSDSLRQKEKH